MDIAVTRGGNPVYTEYKDNSINLVTDEQVQQLVKLQAWKPYGICCSSSDDLLVIMDSDDRKETKVVRYSGTMENNVFSGKVRVNLSFHLVLFLTLNTFVKTGT